MTMSSYPPHLTSASCTKIAVVEVEERQSSNTFSNRSNGVLIMGLKLDNDHTNGKYVLLSDFGTLSEGKGKGGGGTDLSLYPRGRNKERIIVIIIELCFGIAIGRNRRRRILRRRVLLFSSLLWRAQPGPGGRSAR